MKHLSFTELLLFDLDDTLVDTSMLQSLRNNRNWKEVYDRIPETKPLFDSNNLETRELLSWQDKTGIVTSSPRLYAEKICSYHNIKIPVLCAYHDTKKHKPHPDPILFACQKARISPLKTTYIGDNENDMRSILAAGGVGLYIGNKAQAKTNTDLLLDESVLQELTGQHWDDHLQWFNKINNSRIGNSLQPLSNNELNGKIGNLHYEPYDNLDTLFWEHMI
tara:strand:- start:2292 stop:2954 length:663 start_codon:yes stop_codon:yes gene_type:complete